MDYFNRMLSPENLPDYLSRDPEEKPAMRLSYDGACTMIIRNRRMQLTVTSGPGSTQNIDLESVTLAQLCDLLNTKTGFHAELLSSDFTDRRGYALMETQRPIDLALSPTLTVFTSELWCMLRPLAWLAEQTEQDFRNGYQQLVIPSAQGLWVDWWTSVFYRDFPRIPGESDQEYSSRLLYTIRQPWVNNVAIQNYLEEALGYFANVEDTGPGRLGITLTIPASRRLYAYEVEQVSRLVRRIKGGGIALNMAFETIQKVLGLLDGFVEQVMGWVLFQPYAHRFPPRVDKQFTFGVPGNDLLCETSALLVAENTLIISKRVDDEFLPLGSPPAAPQTFLQETTYSGIEKAALTGIGLWKTEYFIEEEVITVSPTPLEVYWWEKYLFFGFTERDYSPDISGNATVLMEGVPVSDESVAGAGGLSFKGLIIEELGPVNSSFSEEEIGRATSTKNKEIGWFVLEYTSFAHADTEKVRATEFDCKELSWYVISYTTFNHSEIEKTVASVVSCKGITWNY